MSLRRLVVMGTAFLAVSPAVTANDEPPRRLTVFADVDDDDDDGRPDGVHETLNARSERDVYWLDAKTRVDGAFSSPVARLVTGGRAFTGAGKARGRVGVQGLAAGSATLMLGGAPVTIDVVEAIALDGRGARVDLASSHAAISRMLPSFLDAADTHDDPDPDAVRWLFAGRPEALPESVSLLALRPDGTRIDRLERVALEAIGCPIGTAPSLVCRATPLIRATGDQVDRAHPESASRSLRAEVGGRIEVMVTGSKVASIRVGGPRTTALGPIERLRARVRVHVLRGSKAGMPAVGGDDEGGRTLARLEVDVASGLWGQCGIHFGPPASLDVAVREPPSPHLVAIGCEIGLPASGGEIRFATAGHRVRVRTEPGRSPVEVARAVARAVEALGLSATVSVNAKTGPSALRTADVLVRRPDGTPSEIAPDGVAPLSSDGSLGACLGEVDLADGLSHFSDADAPAGTIEERALVKAYEDGDPTTIDVFIVPAFSGAGRIGESFIDDPGSSIQNVVILDRAAIRAGARSFALAHELGHVLLDLPGHPDDFGVDRPSSLMDADAADATIFGPRRLSVEDCERAVRQSGPGVAVPLLEPWPMTTTPRAR
ncbi:MAG TPA: hypothetical protein VFZ53_13280 [Polyangiaceae bacterium]